MGDVLLFPFAIVFGISLVVFLYMAGYSWYLGGPATSQSVPWLYSSALVSGVSLFALSNLYYSRRQKGISPPQRLLLAIFDVGAFYSLVALVLWGLLLPMLRPLPLPDFQLYLLDQKSLVVGLYTALILCSLVVVFRVALQFLIVRSSSAVTVITAPMLPAGDHIDAQDKKTLEDSLSSIRSEIAMLRGEMSSLSSSIWGTKSGAARGGDTPDDNPGWAAGDGEPISFPISQLPTSPVSSPIQEQTGIEDLISNVGVQDSPISFSPEDYQSTTNEVQLPDSARDNPWASILSIRQPRVKTSKPVELTSVDPVEEAVPNPAEAAPVNSVEVAEAKPVDVQAAAELPEIAVTNPTDITTPNPAEEAKPIKKSRKARAARKGGGTRAKSAKSSAAFLTSSVPETQNPQPASTFSPTANDEVEDIP